MAVTPAGLRSSSDGEGRWNTQRRLPVSAESPKMRPSEVRTTATLRDSDAGAITSPWTEAVQSTLPEGSTAITSPFNVPATSLPSPIARPPESGFFVSMREATRARGLLEHGHGAAGVGRVHAPGIHDGAGI